jgi:hypothetical protein
MRIAPYVPVLFTTGTAPLHDPYRHTRPQLKAEIVRRIEAGESSLNSLSKLRGMPSAASLYRWARLKPDFARAVHRACDDRNLGLMDQILHIVEPVTLLTLAETRRRIAPLNRRLAVLQRRPGAKWMR